MSEQEPKNTDAVLGDALKKKTRKSKFPTVEEIQDRYTYPNCCVCELCNLCTDRTHIVWNRGNNGKRLMIVGEAPGITEDQYSLPFIGDSGKLLQVMLGSVGLHAQRDAYITNVVKCRPEDNRTPSASEVSKCLPYLVNQIIEAQPRVILAMGATAGKALIEEKPFSITRLRGKTFNLRTSLIEIIVSNYNFISDVQILLTFHPSLLLREQKPKLEPGSNRWLVWQDMQKLKAMLD